MVIQDELITLAHKRYGEYLTKVYSRMADFIPDDSDIVEIGAREDRGVISREILKYRTFLSVDKDPLRGDMTMDALHEDITSDVIISTCLLHHTAEEDIPQVLSHLKADVLLLSGPNIKVMPELFGDHLWHIEIDKLRYWLEQLGFAVEWESSGLSEPHAELLVIAQ